jgi:hypothetical protein
MRRAARLPAVLLLAWGLFACQPADDPDLDAQAEGGEAATEPVGAPQQALPADLASLLAEFASTATQWQAGPVVAEIVVELDGTTWESAAVTYLAADADRFLVLQAGPDGVRQERPTLEGFDLVPVSGDGLDELPDPDGLLDPVPLVAAAADVLDECGVGEPHTVLYSTGAPAAWDGERWTEPPTWTATVSGDGAAVVDPVSGAPAARPCVAG